MDEQNTNQANPHKTVFTGIDMSFGALVKMFLKLGFAALPALIVVWLVLAFLGALLFSI